MLVKDMIANEDPHTFLIIIASPCGSHTYGVNADLPEYILDLAVTSHEYFVFRTDPLQYILWMLAREVKKGGNKRMILKELLTCCTATQPVIIGHSDVNRHGRPIYTTQRFKSPDIISGPILSTYVRTWYIKDGHIMIECSSVPESTDEYIGSMYRTGCGQSSYEFDDEESGYYRKRR